MLALARVYFIHIYLVRTRRRGLVCAHTRLFLIFLAYNIFIIIRRYYLLSSYHFFLYIKFFFFIYYSLLINSYYVITCAHVSPYPLQILIYILQIILSIKSNYVCTHLTILIYIYIFVVIIYILRAFKYMYTRIIFLLKLL